MHSTEAGKVPESSLCMRGAETPSGRISWRYLTACILTPQFLYGHAISLLEFGSLFVHLALSGSSRKWLQDNVPSTNHLRPVAWSLIAAVSCFSRYVRTMRWAEIRFLKVSVAVGVVCGGGGTNVLCRPVRVTTDVPVDAATSKKQHPPKGALRDDDTWVLKPRPSVRFESSHRRFCALGYVMPPEIGPCRDSNRVACVRYMSWTVYAGTSAFSPVFHTLVASPHQRGSSQGSSLAFLGCRLRPL
jgi:hypothetical protein